MRHLVTSSLIHDVRDATQQHEWVRLVGMLNVHYTRTECRARAHSKRNGGWPTRLLDAVCHRCVYMSQHERNQPFCSTLYAPSDTD